MEEIEIENKQMLIPGSNNIEKFNNRRWRTTLSNQQKQQPGL